MASARFHEQELALLKRMRDAPQPEVDSRLRKRFKAMPLSFPAGRFLLQSGNINHAPLRCAVLILCASCTPSVDTSVPGLWFKQSRIMHARRDCVDPSAGARFK